jgi:hypothetical protein
MKMGFPDKPLVPASSGATKERLEQKYREVRQGKVL